jgi:hypothetical protein
MRDIIILGMGPSRAECPFDAETWGVNNGYRQVLTLKGKIHKLFICHRDQEYDWDGDPVFAWNEQNILAEQGVEIVSLFKLKHVKQFTQMPYKKMVERFNTEYFSDSIAYMIAYAIYNNTKVVDGLMKLIEPMRIRMYGVDMFTKDEYATERGGIEYFVAVARTLGVDFWIHPDSAVCKTDTGKPYGFFQLDKKKIDPNNIMELQKTLAGRKKLLKKGVIDQEQFEAMNDRTS